MYHSWNSGHNGELCQSAKIKELLYTYISSRIFDSYSIIIYDYLCICNWLSNSISYF